jgi:azurin
MFHHPWPALAALALPLQLLAATPVSFPYDDAPLRPELWPHARAAVNRDRLYDFYAKQAAWLAAQPQPPDLLIPYPGLDGGKWGHWGNQNEASWKDNRWNATDLGGRLGGVTRGFGQTVVKGVCVVLPGEPPVSACYDPQRLHFAFAWTNGFVRLSDVRRGLLHGLTAVGERIPLDSGPSAQPGDRYLGYHHHGDRVIFAFARNGVRWLDTARAEGGRLVRVLAPESEHPEAIRLRGGPRRWEWQGETQVVRGTTRPWAVDRFPLPFDNPWRALIFPTGHGFLPNGDVLVASFTGDVWRMRGIDAPEGRLRWTRFASGLHQPLGMWVDTDGIFVLGRDQITRLEDRNGDGEADFYACFSNVHDSSPGGHDYITGLERDAQGRFHFVSAKQGFVRLSPDGETLETLASGFRNANGIGLSPDGTLTTAGQEGEWTPTSLLFEIRPGGYYGFPGPRTDRPTTPPLVYLPRGIDNSSGGQAFSPDGRWGPPAGTLAHLSFGAASLSLVLREEGADPPQGLATPLPVDFASGAHRGVFRPADGQLYVTGMNGWGQYAPDDGSFERVRFSGERHTLPIAHRVHGNGIWLRYAHRLDPSRLGARVALAWQYRTAKAYGSPEYSLRHPDTPGHDRLDIPSVHVVGGDGQSLFVEIPQLRPVHVLHLHLDPGLGNGAEDHFLTVHQTRPDFTDFPGYRSPVKEPWGAPAQATPAAAQPNPWRKGTPGRMVRVVAEAGLLFSAKELTATPGERLSLTFDNPDTMPHNWVLIPKGTLAEFGAALTRFIADPRAADRHYLPPDHPVLAYTDMLNPAESQTLHFTAPTEPGDYPYVCTFPGHWPVMHGVLKVRAAP